MNKKTTISLACVMVAWIGSGESSAQDATVPTDMGPVQINAASQQLLEGNVDEALAVYEAAAQTNPANLDLSYNRAVAFYQKGEITKARSLFLQSVNSVEHGLAAKSSFNLGNCDYADAVKNAQQEPAIATELLDQAIVHYRNAIRIDHDDSDARTNIELALMLKKQLEPEEQEQEDQDQQEQDPKEEDQDQQEEGKEQEQSESESESNESESNESDSDESADDSKESNSQDPSDTQQNEKSDSEKSDTDESDSTDEDNSDQGESADQEENADEGDPGSSQQQDPASPDESEEERQEKPGDGKGTESLDENPNDPSEEPGGQSGNPMSPDQKDTEQANPGPSTDTSNGELMDAAGKLDPQEAMKMLQAIRDRDLMRRMQKLRAIRRNHIPVEKDW